MITITCQIQQTMLDERVLPYIERGDDGQCWPWTGRTSQEGYGSVRWQCGCGSRHNTGAHRLSWIAVNGPIPAGMTVDHLCRTKDCQNPQHMEIVTLGENARRRKDKATHCKQGHEFTPENSGWAVGKRYCRTCGRSANRRSSDSQRRRDGIVERPKLPEFVVVGIRKRRAAGERTVDLAREYGLPFNTVSQLTRGHSYPYYDGPIATVDGRKDRKKK